MGHFTEETYLFSTDTQGIVKGWRERLVGCYSQEMLVNTPLIQ